MALYDFDAPRLYLDAPLAAGSALALDRAQANYLLNVLRLRDDDAVLVFNGRDGEWRTKVVAHGRKSAVLVCQEQARPQRGGPDLVYLFAPLKHARLDYIAQKAVEMGVSRIAPVITRRTQSHRVNLDRLRANAIEAAEQCGIVAIPEVSPEEPLAKALEALEPDRLLVFCDEDAPIADPLAALAGLGNRPAKLGVLIGPEGGFTPEERDLVLGRSAVLRLSLGPRVLRADTAGVAALTLVQAALGDWRG
jgi:16S rRNA (uracil1498-N3)-methyltransferase